MTHRIHPPAKDRLLDIWAYTESTWDSEQADRYVSGLIAELDRIAESPHRWRSVSKDGFEGVFFARYEHHFVFFRKLSDGVLGVVSILHEANGESTVTLPLVEARYFRLARQP